jgi:23S rRNA pseudouridine1911/1915/1917 synthase
METRQPTSQQDFQAAGQPAARAHFRTLGPAIENEGQGERLDAYVSRKFPFLTRGGWQNRIFSGCLRVNERIAPPAYKLERGDRLTFFHPPAAEPEVDRGIRELWRDGGVMAVFKPGNLPMHENGPYRFNTFSHLVREAFGEEWAALHRLDRETSGIVLCGATPAARNRLSADWAARRVKKEYLAIVNGVTVADAWTADGPVGDLATSAIRIKKWVVAGGLDAITNFTTLDRSAGHSLLRAAPETGRTNQIRIHAAHAGHHLVGDKLYHPDEQVFLDYFEDGNTEDVQRRAGFHRLCLHASKLVFSHPEHGRTIEVEAALPDDMARLWSVLQGN